MEKSKKTGLWVGLGVLVLAVLGGGGWYLSRGHSVPAFPLNPSDHIASWQFKGAYTGQPPFEKKAQEDIAKQRVYLKTGKYDAYDVYIGIANDYALLGNGRAAYQNYNRAIALFPNQGLAYSDLGALMSELGARYTAADAYAKAETVEPAVLTYHLEQLQFLTSYFATDTPRVAAAFDDASKQFGDIAQVLAIEAQWLTGQGRYADAIAAWQRAILISPGRDVSSMQQAITQLKAKEAQQAAASSTKP